MSANPNCVQSHFVAGFVDTITFPQQATAGNLLVVSGIGEGATDPTPPAGWTLLVSDTLHATHGRYVAYWKIADGSEVDVTITGWGFGGLQALAMAEYEAGSGWAGVDGAAVTVGPDSNSTQQATTTPTVDGLAVGFTMRSASAGDEGGTTTGILAVNSTVAGLYPRQLEIAATPATAGEDVTIGFDLGYSGLGVTVIGVFEEDNPPADPRIDFPLWSANVLDTNNDNDIAVTVPAGVAAGDRIVAMLIIGENRTIATAPADFDLDVSQVDDTPLRRAYIYSKAADGTEGGTAVTFTLDGNTTVKQARIVVLRPVNGNVVNLHDTETAVDGSPSATHTTPAAATTDPYAIAVEVLSCDSTTGGRLWDGPQNRASFMPQAEGLGAFGLAVAVAAGAIPGAGYAHVNGDPHGSVAYATAIYATAPAPDDPINVTATAISSSQIRVDWTTVLGATGYYVERSDDGITGWVNVSGPLPASPTSYVDGGLQPETTYYYRVTSVSGGGDSDPSSVVFATTFPESTPVPNPDPGNPWIRSPEFPILDMAICVTETYTRTRPFSAVQPIGGGLPTVITGAPGGRDYTLVISIRTITEQRQLEDLLASPLVYYQPPCDRDLWMAPDQESIVVTKVGRIRQMTVNFVETGPFPWPTPESFFEAPFPPLPDPESPGESPAESPGESP